MKEGTSMKWYIDFDGYCEIEAENEEEAEQEFWRLISEDKPLPSIVLDINGIEKVEGE